MDVTPAFGGGHRGFHGGGGAHRHLALLLEFSSRGGDVVPRFILGGATSLGGGIRRGFSFFASLNAGATLLTHTHTHTYSPLNLRGVWLG